MRKYLAIAALPLLLMASCAGSTEEYIASADSTNLANDISDINSPSRKIAKTVDVRCRVKNILKTVSAIEERTKDFGGLVALSELQNETVERKTLHYKADSLKEVSIYNATAHMQLRVPAFLIDTMLATLPAMVQFIEYRNIKQDDRTLAYLRTAMKNELYTGKIESSKPAEAKERIQREQAMFKADSAKAEQIIDRRIDNLQLLDDVNYTTVNIDLSEDNLVHTAIIPNTSYAATEPFFTQLTFSLSKGLDILKGITVTIVAIWPILLIGTVLWMIYKRQRNRFRPM